MSRRRDRWSAVTLPGVARAQARYNRMVQDGVRQLAERQPEAFSQVVRSTGLGSAVMLGMVTEGYRELQRDAEILELAALYWVTDQLRHEISHTLNLPAASAVSALFWRSARNGQLAITAYTWSGYLAPGAGPDSDGAGREPMLESPRSPSPAAPRRTSSSSTPGSR